MNIRAGAGGFIFRTYFIKNMTGKAATPEQIKESEDMLHTSLKVIQKIWITGQSKFMFGDEPSIADLSLACELTQLEGIQFPMAEMYPKIHAWYQNMLTLKGF